MSKINPFIACAGVALGAIFWARSERESKEAFENNVVGKGITDPIKVWEACMEYNKKLREELIESKAKIKSAEELVKVAQGLKDTRAMIEDQDPPHEVKKVIVSYWWTQLIKLFVPWGIIISEEVETSEPFKFARISDHERLEAELRYKINSLTEENKMLRATIKNTG